MENQENEMVRDAILQLQRLREEAAETEDLQQQQHNSSLSQSCFQAWQQQFQQAQLKQQEPQQNTLLSPVASDNGSEVFSNQSKDNNSISGRIVDLIEGYP